METQETPKNGIKETTLKALGQSLPIGLEDGAPRAFSFKRWNLRKEKELGEIRKKLPGSNLGDWVSILIGEMATQVGTHNLTSLNDAERRLLVSQMWMQDVLYAYFCLRYWALGNIMKIKMECPFHDFEFTWPGDLNTMKVRTVEKIEDLYWSMELEDPFTLRSMECKTLSLGPVKWSAVEQAELGRRVNHGKLKAVMVQASIREINGEPIAVAENELDEMSKRDLERLVAEIDDHACGPDLSLDVRCPDKKCDRRFVTSLDWSYDTFFSTTSR